VKKVIQQQIHSEILLGNKQTEEEILLAMEFSQKSILKTLFKEVKKEDLVVSQSKKSHQDV
jgi:hypothetical protein